MPPASKKARLAKAQRPDGSIEFTKELLEDIEELEADSNYIPSESEDDSAEDSDASIEPEPLYDSDSDTDMEESEAIGDTLVKAKAFWSRVLDQVSICAHRDIYTEITVLSIEANVPFRSA